jgi:diguanylate cyclase (GGDEF)-like protein
MPPRKTSDSILALGLYWVPFAFGLASACVYISYMYMKWSEIDPATRVVSLLGIIIGLLAVAQAVFAAGDTRALARSRANEQTLQEHLDRARTQTRKLNSHLEVLTAMREMTRILSDAVEFKQIAQSVFEVLEPLLDAREIALILKEGDDGELAVKALRRESRTVYEDQLSGDEVDLDLPRQALRQQILVKSISDGKAVFCVPLVADQIAVGVMRFAMDIEGSDAEREQQLEDFEIILVDIAKHLALVVKTPTLHDRAIIDSLTGLFTRRHFDIRIDDMFRLARRYATPFSLILIDLDRFKEVNDKHGHRAGDTVLRETAALVTGGIRDCDSAFRYGGEEFAVLLPETAVKHAEMIAERLRKAVRANEVQLEQGPVVAVTVSLGVAEYHPGLASQGELVALADRALYRAKQGGRDRTATARPDDEEAGQ